MAPVAKLTEACPILSADEVTTLLGSDVGDTKLAVKENKPNTTGGNKSYTCEYGSAGEYPFALTVMGIKQTAGYTPKVAVDAMANTGAVKTHRVTGVGSDAVFYTDNGGISVLAAAKSSHGQVRTFIFSGPDTLPEKRFIEVEKLVAKRL